MLHVHILSVPPRDMMEKKNLIIELCDVEGHEYYLRSVTSQPRGQDVKRI
jgi:hypothetical protein